jgi:hypothetical protein
MITIDKIIKKFNDCNKLFDSKYNIIPIIFWGIQDKATLIKYINDYCKNDKINIVFIVSDYSEPLDNLENVLIFRTSMYKKYRLSYEYILPYFWECNSINFMPLKKSDKPIISFCGQNNCIERSWLIDYFKSSNLFESKFIIRDDFWGGNVGSKDVIKDFNDNIASSHFVISSRGGGNFSMRFYQVLAAGRIPILIDSNMLLPFEELINWDDYIIVGKTAKEVGDKIIKFWNNSIDKDIINRQIACRRIFDKYIYYESFIDNVVKNYLNISDNE